MQSKIIQRVLPALIMVMAFGLNACTAPAPAQTAAPAAMETSAAPETQPPAAGEISVVDGRGRTITLPEPAMRIVSLAPSNTEIVYAIGAGDRLVGRDTFSDYPEEAKQAADIGGGFGELNMEVILTQEPDLVLASALTPDEQVKALEDAGLTVFVLPNPQDFDGMYANLRSAAALTGQEQAAETLIGGYQQRVAAVDEKLAGLTKKPQVFYEIDGTDPNAVYTPGPDSFVHMLLTRAGGENIAADLGGEWPKINLEALIARQPEIILLGDAYWGGVTPEAVAARAGWDALAAVREGKVYPFDDNLVSRPGPRMVDGLEALAKLFHPELFQ